MCSGKLKDEGFIRRQLLAKKEWVRWEKFMNGKINQDTVVAFLGLPDGRKWSTKKKIKSDKQTLVFGVFTY